MFIMSEKIDELVKALCSLQNSLPKLTKESKGYAHKYADLTTCLEAIREPLRDNGFALTHIVTIEEGQTILATFLLHTSGQWMKASFPLHADMVDMKNKIQAFGSVITYARRYSLTAMIGLTQEDDDGTKGGTIYSPPSKSMALSGVDFSNMKGKFVKDSTSIYPNKPTIKENDYEENKSKKLVVELRLLCEEYNIDMNDFAAFHKIQSKNILMMENIIKNFMEFYDSYKLAKLAQAPAWDVQKEKVQI